MKYGIFLKLCTINLTEFPLHYSSVITNLISSEEATDSAEACVNLEPSEDCMCCIHWSIHNSEVLRNLQRHCHNALQCFTTHCAWVSEWVSRFTQWKINNCSMTECTNKNATLSDVKQDRTQEIESEFLRPRLRARSTPWDPDLDWDPDQTRDPDWDPNQNQYFVFETAQNQNFGLQI